MDTESREATSPQTAPVQQEATSDLDFSAPLKGNPTPEPAPQEPVDTVTPQEEPGEQEIEWTDDLRKQLGFKEVDGKFYAIYHEFDDGSKVVYEDLDAARKGLVAKETYLRKVKQEAEARMAALQQERDRYRQELATLTARMKPEDFDKVRFNELYTNELNAILDKLDPALKTITDPDDIADDETRERYLRAVEQAKLEAHANLKIEKREIEQQQKEQAERLAKARAEATEWFKKTMTYENFGVFNSEDQEKAQEFLTQPVSHAGPDGKQVNLVETLFELRMIDPPVAEIFWEGLKAKFHGTVARKPEPKKPEETRVYTPQVPKTVPTANPNAPVKMTATERMKQGLRGIESAV